MAAVLKSQMSDREIPIRSIFDSYRHFFINKITDTGTKAHIGDNLSYLYAAPHENGADLVHWCKIM